MPVLGFGVAKVAVSSLFAAVGLGGYFSVWTLTEKRRKSRSCICGSRLGLGVKHGPQDSEEEWLTFGKTSLLIASFVHSLTPSVPPLLPSPHLPPFPSLPH